MVTQGVEAVQVDQRRALDERAVAQVLCSRTSRDAGPKRKGNLIVLLADLAETRPQRILKCVPEQIGLYLACDGGSKQLFRDSGPKAATHFRAFGGNGARLTKRDVPGQGNLSYLGNTFTL